MPTKRHRRAQSRRESLADSLRHLLLTGEPRADDPHELLALRRLSRNAEALRAAWVIHRDVILAAHPKITPWAARFDAEALRDAD